MAAATRILMGAVVCLAACASASRGNQVELRWPAAVPPAGATDLHYEVMVWARERNVPTTLIRHERRVLGTCLVLRRLGLPEDGCWSVRAHWLEDGKPRQSRWLAAGGVPVSTAEVPSRRFASLP